MRIFLVTAFLIFFHLTGLGQSISDLRQKKEAVEKEIEYTTQLLNAIQKDEKTSLNRLRLINSRIGQRNTLINTITDEINVYQECISNNSIVIEMLVNDLEEIKKE